VLEGLYPFYETYNLTISYQIYNNDTNVTSRVNQTVPIVFAPNDNGTYPLKYNSSEDYQEAFKFVELGDYKSIYLSLHNYDRWRRFTF